MKVRKGCVFFVLTALILSMIPWAGAVSMYVDEHVIQLHSEANASSYIHNASLDGAAVEDFTDYVWHVNPGEDHTDVENAPAEYYTGEKPDTDAAVYIAHDILYYPRLSADGFRMVQYDDDREWCYYYPETSAYHEYIFATLPAEGTSVPERMMHTPEEA